MCLVTVLVFKVKNKQNNNNNKKQFKTTTVLSNTKYSLVLVHFFRLRRPLPLYGPVSLGSRLSCLQGRRKLGIKGIDPDVRLCGGQQRRHVHGLLRLRQQQQPQPVHFSRTEQLSDRNNGDAPYSVQTGNVQLRIQYGVSGDSQVWS